MSNDASKDDTKARQEAEEALARKRKKTADPDDTSPNAGIRPDLAEPGEDGRGGNAGGVGKSM